MKEINKIIKIIKSSQKIVLFHHVNPDGDSLSSSYGLMKALQLKFPQKQIKWVADVENIEKSFGYIAKDMNDVIQEVDETWTAIVGDVAIKDRIYRYDLFEKAGKKIVFDHHTNDKDVACDAYYQDSTLGASSVQAYYIVKKIGIKLDSSTAIAILFGILTDTFNFTYSLNDRRPIDATSELMSYIEKDELDEMYKNLRKRTIKDIKFQGYALSNFESSEGIAYLKMDHKKLKAINLTPNEASRVNLIANIEGIGAWAFFIEDKENDCIKVSLRSIGLPVNEVASKFGGGGHVRASGIKLDNDWKIVDKVITELKKQYSNYDK